MEYEVGVGCVVGMLELLAINHDMLELDPGVRQRD